MPKLMRCKYCGTLQDEPPGAKICAQCGGELVWETPDIQSGGSYVRASLELDQVSCPAGQTAERYLILSVSTPDEVPAAEQVKTTVGRPPMHFCAVLDVSGSMRGNKISAAKKAVQQAVQRLQDGDTFSLVTFASDVRCSLDAKTVDGALRRIARSSIDEIQAGGQTALCGGLEEGIARVLKAPCDTNLVLLLSDGQANVGEVDIEAVGRRALDARAKGITVSTLGVGNDYNEAMMAEIALDGGGRFYHIAHEGQIAAYLGGELGEMASLAARNVKAILDLPAGTTLESLSSAYPVSGKSVSLGDIPVETHLEVVLRLLLPPQSAGTRLPVSGRVEYRTPAGNVCTTPLNTVTVRYEAEGVFENTLGVVKPTVRRVLEHMQSVGVFATSKATSLGADQGREKGRTTISRMRAYAARLGEADEEAKEILDEGSAIMNNFMAASPQARSKAKADTHAAMQRHRGSKDFKS